MTKSSSKADIRDSSAEKSSNNAAPMNALLLQSLRSQLSSIVVNGGQTKGPDDAIFRSLKVSKIEES